MLLISPFILGVVLLRQYLLYELIVSCLPIIADDRLDPPSYIVYRGNISEHVPPPPPLTYKY